MVITVFLSSPMREVLIPCACFRTVSKVDHSVAGDIKSGKTETFVKGLHLDIIELYVLQVGIEPFDVDAFARSQVILDPLLCSRRSVSHSATKFVNVRDVGMQFPDILQGSNGCWYYVPNDFLGDEIGITTVFISD